MTQTRQTKAGTIEKLKEELIQAFSQLNEDQVYQLIDSLTEEACPTSEIDDCLNAGMKLVGDFFEKGDYFIADLMFSGMIYCSVLEKIHPQEAPKEGTRKGRVLLGVVEKDIHDIGKDIVVSLLTADNFDVIDLGVDVSSKNFVDAIRQYHPQILSLSGMMSFALDSMKETIEAIEDAGLRDQVSIVCGGGCIEGVYPDFLKADFISHEPSETLKFCNDVILRRCQP